MTVTVLDENKNKLLARLSQNWPAHLKLSMSEGVVQIADKHILCRELSALVHGTPTSFPFFMPKENEVRWFTAAATAEDLRTAIDRLRCWILPSCGWEEAVNPIISPGNARGRLGKLITSIFPSGYFRWRSTIADFEEVVKRLESIHKLDDRKPAFVFERTPSLFELRQQYRLALATGDRDTAIEAVQTIDHYQLDTALNTTFMRLKLWDQFRDHQEIVNTHGITELAHMRIPRSTRLAILKAHHTVHIAPYEEIPDLEKATDAYQEYLHPFLIGVIRGLRPEDGQQVRRCMGYLARVENDRHLAEIALSGTDDFILKSIVDQLPPVTTKPPSEDTDVFNRAMRRNRSGDVEISID